jgi:RimJ/RimL family protein N-acetyltransferase
MADILECETPRLRLRQWHRSDREPFAAMNADGRVMQYFPVPLTREASDAMIERCQRLIEQRGWGLWAVERKDDRAFIGFVGLHIPVPELPCSPCVEVGWRLAFVHWGKGFATEAAAEALRVGFETLSLTEIVSFTSLRNLPSIAVMQRLGMVRDARTFEHPSVPVGSDLREHCLYRLSSHQWKAH